MEFFDSHAHYNDEKFKEDREEVLKEIQKTGISKLIVAGYDIKGSKEALRIAEEHDWVYATCGISPNDLVENVDEAIDSIRKLCKSSKKIVAIGEIGLDYYWNKDNSDKQKPFFRKQIELANELDLPIVIHSRDAHVDTISMLKENPCNKKGVFHCCQLNQELIREALELGFYISFAGPITFKNSKNAPEIIRKVPLDRIFIETDSPYLAPEPVRGTRNDSRNVIYIAKKIAEIKEIELQEVAQATYENVCRLFGIRVKNDSAHMAHCHFFVA